MRLSKDDLNEGESASIKSQRKILREYASLHGIAVEKEYVDDGYSGTTYDRPAFCAMINDIEIGVVNCVITKDLSRLGRNSARTSELIEEFFPSMGVRYIAVSESFDTYSTERVSSLYMPFMLVMNEMYARDISVKIKESFRAKMNCGEYIGNFAPYGYKKDVEHGNRNRLVPDAEAAETVREIFKRASIGEMPSSIACDLNERGVPPPSVYRCIKNPHLDADNYSKCKKWTSSGICKLLKNRVYIGNTVQGKTFKPSFKSKKPVRRPRELWVEVPSTHEPIVTKELFEAVQNRRTPRGKRKK